MPDQSYEGWDYVPMSNGTDARILTSLEEVDGMGVTWQYSHGIWDFFYVAMSDEMVAVRKTTGPNR